MAELTMKPKEFKKAWVKALRSGSYRRGEGELAPLNRDGSGRSRRQYCCLGVAARVLGLLKLDAEIGRDTCKYQGRPSETMLPDPLLRDLHMTSALADRLAAMNDAGDGFGTIADYIEETYRP